MRSCIPTSSSSKSIWASNAQRIEATLLSANTGDETMLGVIMDSNDAVSEGTRAASTEDKNVLAFVGRSQIATMRM